MEISPLSNPDEVADDSAFLDVIGWLGILPNPERAGWAAIQV
jgi:hypothetical protein